MALLTTLGSGAAWAQWSSGGRALVGSTSRATSIAMSVEKQIPLQTTIRSWVPKIPEGLSLDSPFLRGILQVRETTSGPTNLFSGTAFQTEYNGKKEVYVAIAAHAIRAESYQLHRNFTADIYIGNGQYKSVPVQIVQESAPSMLDVAIGKVLEGEEELTPFSISHLDFTYGDKAVSYGFTGRKLVIIPNRMFTSQTPLCRRTTMPYPRNDRMGFCGSALVDENGDLLGIHTGSTYGRYGEQDDIGHATNARLLEVLVDAYHHNGESTFPLILGGQKVLDMPVQGYVSFIRLMDANGKLQWQRGFDSKFAYDDVNERISIFSPRYVELTTRRVHWDGDQLREIRNSTDKTRRTFRYDFVEGKIVWESKPKE